MKYHWLFILVVLSSCGGSLSDEQRKKIQEEMRNSKITRVSEAQITEAAFAKGRTLITKLTHTNDTSRVIDSIRTNERIGISLVTGKSYEKAGALERSIYDAYASTPVSILQDNLQKIRNDKGEDTDSLLYSNPIVVQRRLNGVWNIWLSRKQLVLSVTEKR